MPVANSDSRFPRTAPPGAPLGISVVMPVRNEAASIQSTLRGVLAQEYPQTALEILVIDGGSSDGTPQLVSEIAEADQRVRLLENPRRWSSSARNVGVRAAKGEVVVIVDGHCQFPGRDYFHQLARAFEESGADCLGRPQTLMIDGGTPQQRAIAAARGSLLGHHPSSFIYAERPQFVPAHSVAVAYRQSVFERLGGFDESFDACEDVEFNHRIDLAGLRCWFTPAIGLRYHPRGSLAGLFRQLARYGRGRVRLARKHPSTASWSTFAPAVLLMAAVAAVGLALLVDGARLPVSLLAGMYVLLCTAVALHHRIRHPAANYWWWMPACFACIHFGAGWGECWELLWPRHSGSERGAGGTMAWPASEQSSQSG